MTAARRQRMTRKRLERGKQARRIDQEPGCRGFGGQDDATGTASSGFLSHRVTGLACFPSAYVEVGEGGVRLPLIPPCLALEGGALGPRGVPEICLFSEVMNDRFCGGSERLGITPMASMMTHKRTQARVSKSTRNPLFSGGRRRRA